MSTARNRFEEPRRNRFFNLPLLLTIGAMILLGITTVTLGFVLWPEPKQWDETVAPPGQAPDRAPRQAPGTPPGPAQGLAPGKTPGPDTGQGSPDAGMTGSDAR